MIINFINKILKMQDLPIIVLKYLISYLFSYTYELHNALVVLEVVP